MKSPPIICLFPRPSLFALASLVVLLLAPAMVSATVFTVVNTNASGPGSLKQAAEDANAAGGGPHLIAFAIPGGGVHKIDLRDTEVIVFSSITIDGYTQPGAKPNTLTIGDNAVILIQLDGGGPGYNGTGTLRMVDSFCLVRGLSFTGFSTAIDVGNIEQYLHGGNRIEGNFIGLEPDGVTLNGNDYGVVLSGGEGESVGGDNPAARNVISGNLIGVLGGFTITGNYFGTDASGFRQGYGNRTAINGEPQTIVGTAQPGSGNVITGNNIGIFAPGGVKIQGNLIGPRPDGSASFGNNVGISLAGRSNIVGGSGPGEGNVIASNSGNGVEVRPRISTTSQNTEKNAILSNLIYDNLGLDIDLGRDGPTANDYGDADSGPNNLQNFPIINSVLRDAGTTTVRGALNSSSSTTFTLQFFASRLSPAPSQKLLGTQTVRTNASGDAFFTFTFATATSDEEFITATATDPNGNTSEFFPREGPVELVNLSARGNVGTGDNILIGGYIFDGSQPDKVLIRAMGPSLGLTGALADPQLEVRYSDGSLAAMSRSWRGPQEADIRATGLAPTDDREPAVIFSPLTPTPFNGVDNRRITVQVSGENGTTGIATVEVYKLRGTSGSSFGSAKLRNISTRGFVAGGDDVLIAGTIIEGSVPQKLIFRAIGPGLAQAGIGSPLQDPALELRDSNGNLLAANDNWRDDQEEEITKSGLAPNDEREAAIIALVVPTSYTAVVRGARGTTGIGLVEIYALD